MTEINEQRLAKVMELPLLAGSHDPDSKYCVMEAAAYIAGEPWSDDPECVCPTITRFMVAWNDSLPTNDDRDRLLKPLLTTVIGTRSTDAVAERRGYMALDWLIRVHAPAWLDLRADLRPHATALRDLDEIVDLAAATAAGEKVRAAWDAARDAARDAAWDAARAAAGAAARDAARDAARAAARDAAWAAARDAARAAAGDAAWDAARAAAGDAARAAAGDVLKPTTAWLQVSASDLVRRMCEVSE